MIWIIFSIIAASIWALVNHIDKYLLEKYCKDTNAGSLVLFSSLIGIPVVIILAIFNHDIFSVSVSDIIILIVTGALYIIAVTFYLYALDSNETSTIAPQMLITPILSAVLAGVFLDEQLTYRQILVFIIILIASLGLSLDIKDLKINFKGFLFMLTFSIFTSINAILFKFMSQEVGFWITALWNHVGFIFMGIVFFLYKPYRSSFITMIRSNGSGIISMNIISEIITIVANLVFYYATLLGPIAIVQSFTEGIQPIFVFLIGIFLTLLFPKLASEDLSRPNIIKKIVFISVMIVTITFSGIY